MKLQKSLLNQKHARIQASRQTPDKVTHKVIHFNTQLIQMTHTISKKDQPHCLPLQAELIYSMMSKRTSISAVKNDHVYSVEIFFNQVKPITTSCIHVKTVVIIYCKVQSSGQ